MREESKKSFFAIKLTYHFHLCPAVITFVLNEIIEE